MTAFAELEGLAEVAWSPLVYGWKRSFSQCYLKRKKSLYDISRRLKPAVSLDPYKSPTKAFQFAAFTPLIEIVIDGVRI